MSPSLVPALIGAATFVLAYGANEESRETRSNLILLETRFEPLREGKNVVYIEVQNQARQDQTFAVHIQTRAGGGRPQWGWGRPFFETVRAGQKARIRIPYKIYPPLNNAASIRVQYYNPPSPAEYEFEKWFKQTRYTAADLPSRSGSPASQPVSSDEEKAAVTTWRMLQDHLRGKACAKAWELFSTDLKKTEFSEGTGSNESGVKSFSDAMDLPVSFWWSRSELLGMEAREVVRCEGELVLTAALDQRLVLVHLVQAGQTWQIDAIGLFTPTSQWKPRVLSLMQKHATEHFDIFFLSGSTAARQIDRLTERREGAFREVCDFAGQVPHTRICVILFEDGQSKKRVTGHQGDGWAFGDTVVEVYNEKTQLDPHHEISHIVMANVGSPPALFNEGLAVSMQTGHTWEGQSVQVTSAKLAADGRLVPLKDLITRTEIGARKDDGQVAYPEAASFVTFLIDHYGRERFLQAYRTLANSGDPIVQAKNLETFERIYGRGLSDLETEWRQALAKSASQPS